LTFVLAGLVAFLLWIGVGMLLAVLSLVGMTEVRNNEQQQHTNKPAQNENILMDTCFSMLLPVNACSRRRQRISRV
jgi:hypothetical protein